MLKRLRDLLIILGITVILAELVLQTASFVLGKVVPHENSRASDEVLEVLCVGDSFTYGMGASKRSFSYPSQLERLLNEREDGQQWKVINAGLPGRDSSDMIREIERQLAESTPDFLCFVGAANDFWKFPEATTVQNLSGETAEKEGFTFEFRLLKLYRTLKGGDVFETKEGKGIAAGGEEGHQVAAAASPENEEEVIALPEVEYVSPPINDGSWPGMDAGWEKLSQEDFLGAAESFALAKPTEPAFALAGMATAYARIQDDAKMQEILEEFETLYSSDPSQRNAEGWISAAYSSGDHEAGIALYDKLIADHPSSHSSHFFASSMQLAVGDNHRARALSDLALETLDKHVEVGLRAWFWRMRARVYAAEEDFDFEECERAVINAHRLDGNKDATRENYLQVGNVVNDGTLATILEEYDETEPINAQAFRIRKGVIVNREEQETRDILSGHVRDILRVCKDQNITPVVSTYPFTAERISGSLKVATEEVSMPLIRVDEVFEEKLRSASWDTYFIHDGHCNDDGYRIMAEVIEAGFPQVK